MIMLNQPRMKRLCDGKRPTKTEKRPTKIEKRPTKTEKRPTKTEKRPTKTAAQREVQVSLERTHKDC